MGGHGRWWCCRRGSFRRKPAGTAEFLCRPLGLQVPVNRIRVPMPAGDRALILRLNQRLPEGPLLTAEEMQGGRSSWHC